MKKIKQKIKRRLGVNIDHIATIRELRKCDYPSVLEAAEICKKLKVDQVTCHLRLDRRHIQDADVILLKKKLKLALNLEISTDASLINFVKKIKPDRVTLVPERRGEMTTEGGLNIQAEQKSLAHVSKIFTQAGIKVSLFVNPDLEDIQLASKMDIDAIEIHTGLYAEAKNKKSKSTQLKRIVQASKLASQLGLKVFAGHGLNIFNVKDLTQIKEIEEYNIGHAIIARAVMIGLEKAIKEMLLLLK